MPDKVEALGVLLVLLPGFACAYLVQMLAVRRKQTELDKVVEALLFSLILYVVTLPLFGNIFPVHWQSVHSASADVYQMLIDWKHLGTLALCAVVLAVLYAANINHDWLLSFFRRIKVTERTARSSVWNDVFQRTGGFVQVSLADGRSVMGWLSDYSDEAAESTLFLEDASWVVQDEDGHESEIEIAGPGILLTRQIGIESVIFLGWQRKAKSTLAENGEPNTEH